MAGVNRRGRWASETGAELIEFALVFPLLLLVMLGVFDFGLLFQRYEVVTNAAREGARVSVLPGYTATDVELRVAQYLAAGGLTEAPTVTSLDPTAVPIGAGGTCMTVGGVTVGYPHPFTFVGGIVGYFGGSGFTTTTLTATATMRYEGAAISCP